MIYFDSDYMEGAHPEVLRRLVETNLEHTVGYGCDPYTQQAKEVSISKKMHFFVIFFAFLLCFIFRAA